MIEISKQYHHAIIQDKHVSIDEVEDSLQGLQYEIEEADLLFRKECTTGDMQQSIRNSHLDSSWPRGGRKFLKCVLNAARNSKSSISASFVLNYSVKSVVIAPE